MQLALPAVESPAQSRIAPAKAIKNIGLFALGALVVLAAFLAADLFLNARAAKKAGLNIEAYRGPLLGPKASGELRILFLGASTGYGYGVDPANSIPAQLQTKLSQQLGRPITVVNLAYNGESATCLPSTLRYYDYLHPDAVFIYMSESDLLRGSFQRNPATCIRNRSAIFRLTGYLPILPDVLRERSFQLRYGSIDKGYSENEPIRIPNDPHAVIPNAPVQIGARDTSPTLATTLPSSAETIQRYVDGIVDVTASQVAAGRAVFISSEPYGVQDDSRGPQVDQHEQQAALQGALQAHFGDSPKVRYIDPPTDLNMADKSVSPDTLHLTESATRVLANELAARIGEPLTRLYPVPQATREQGSPLPSKLGIVLVLLEDVFDHIRNAPRMLNG